MVKFEIGFVEEKRARGAKRDRGDKSPWFQGLPSKGWWRGVRSIRTTEGPLARPDRSSSGSASVGHGSFGVLEGRERRVGSQPEARPRGIVEKFGWGRRNIVAAHHLINPTDAMDFCFILKFAWTACVLSVFGGREAQASARR